MLAGEGSPTHVLSEWRVAELLAQALGSPALDGQRLLVIIPDATRTAPIPLLFRLLCTLLAKRMARLDMLIALGTHQPLTEAEIDRLIGMEAAERDARFPNVTVFNHAWDQPTQLVTLGTLAGDELASITDGLLSQPTPVQINRAILDYDAILICGPVFPHEVAGFSGGAKYLFPGIAGPEIIDATHWLGALNTSMATIGIAHTPVRQVIHAAAALVPRPVLCAALVLQGTNLHGLYIGTYTEAWQAAVALSAQLNIVWKPKPFGRVLAVASPKYADLWTAAKAMYKTEPVVADGGEVIVFAPHITEASYTHGTLIDQVGYHVRDYFLAQWSRFGHIPGGILAHSTHVKGHGSYDAEHGIERPRIWVTLATGITEQRCHQLNLGYLDHRTIDPATWANREHEGRLLVPNAGEVLYRIGDGN